MPFELDILHVAYEPEEIVITGRVATGAYAGPESVVVPGTDGRELHTVVTHHGIENPVDWPVLPSHPRTILLLHVARPSTPFEVDVSRPVCGRGAVTSSPDRVDITEVLDDPLFLSLRLAEELASEACEEPEHQCFGVERHEVDAYYRSVFEERYKKGIWPFTRLDLDHGRFLEIEFAGGFEHQERFWIGRGTRRVLLGYNSGHFSLPAFRLAEVEDLAHRGKGPRHAAAMVLALTATSVAALDPGFESFVAGLLARLPAPAGPLAPMAPAFCERCVVPALEWREDPQRGWVNNWDYSQRNPQGPMSLLTLEDFRFIREFFAEVPGEG